MADLTVLKKSVQSTIIKSTDVMGDKMLGLYDRGAVIKAYPFYYTNDTGSTLADGSIIELTTIGPGYILPSSHYSVTAMDTSRVLNIGTQEYTDKDGTTVISDINALLVAKDVSSAVSQAAIGSDTASLAYGDGYAVTGQVDILAQVTGGTIPDGAVISGVLHVLSA